MKRILLRAGKSPFEALTPETTLDRNLLGTNSGNLLFSNTAYRLLMTQDAKITINGMLFDPKKAPQINERYDVFVVPLASAFRYTFQAHLANLTELIKGLKIPVVILGAGAQSTLDYDFEHIARLDEGVKAFVSAVLDHGPTIGVRGEFSADYLRRLGFSAVEVIGCPSMFMHGAQIPVEKKSASLAPNAKLSINVSPYLTEMGPVVRYHYEKYRNLVYIPQDEQTLRMMLWGERVTKVKQTELIPTYLGHPLFRENQVRYFVDPPKWMEYLKGFAFSFGTRIHGNIASLVAGTPAYVLAHDSRTLELVRYFEIPHRKLTEVTPTTDAAELFAEADYGPMQKGHAARFATFAAYMKKHGLTHVFEEGQDPTLFDQRVATTPYPPGVEAITDADSFRLAHRMRRLRDESALQVSDLTKRVRALETKLAKLEKQAKQPKL